MLAQKSRINPREDKEECRLPLRVPASAVYTNPVKPSKHKHCHGWLMPQGQVVGCEFIYMMCRMYIVIWATNSDTSLVPVADILCHPVFMIFWKSKIMSCRKLLVCLYIQGENLVQAYIKYTTSPFKRKKVRQFLKINLGSSGAGRVDLHEP